MDDAFQLWEIAYPVAAGLLSFAVVGYRWERTPWVARGVHRLFRVDPAEGFAWLRWWHIALVVFAAFVVTAVFDDTAGLLACQGTGVSDTFAQWASGQAWLFGGDPFQPTVCGGSIPVPYGLAAVVLDGIGSLGGALGIWLVWDAAAVALIPLTWYLAGSDRRYITVFVATSLLYLPLVAAQIDGATNVFVAVTVLATLWLARKSWNGAAILGGFLSTARFPSLFPVLGATGSAGRQRWTAPALALAVFGGLTALSYAYWGTAFSGVVLFAQVQRASGSINAFGILFVNNWWPQSIWVTVLQAVVVVVLTEEVHRRRFAPLEAAAIVLVGLTLTTQFLSYNILSWLLPVALLGLTAQRWLFAVSVIGTVNYALAEQVWGLQLGVWWPSEVLDILLTVVLVLLLIRLWSSAASAAPPPSLPKAGATVHPDSAPRAGTEG